MGRHGASAQGIVLTGLFRDNPCGKGREGLQMTFSAMLTDNLVCEVGLATGNSNKRQGYLRTFDLFDLPDIFLLYKRQTSHRMKISASGLI